MKKTLVAFICSALGLVCSPVASAPPESSLALSTADQAWMKLQASPPLLAVPGAARSVRPTDPAEIKVAMAKRATAFVTQADQAKDFHVRFPRHGKAPEAKLLEVQALVNAVQTADATIEGRLASAVQAMRADSDSPASIQVQAVAAYEFSRRTRGLKTHEERLKAIERTARELAADFPDQPQGFESLLTLASNDRDDANARKIARDLLTLPAPAAVKNEAQKLLSRFDLMGKSLSAELDGANETAAKAGIKRGLPTIVYTWASSSPGSLALAADLKQRGLAANILSLNLDTDPAAAALVAQREGLVGRLVYDVRGSQGALAQRLKIRRAAEILLVDERGVICDVRAQGDLANKLKKIGL